MSPSIHADLMELLPVAAYLVDGQGYLRKYNRRAALVWGREPACGPIRERFCGAHRLYSPDGRFLPRDQCPLAVALHTRRPLRNITVVIERPDGSRRLTLANIDLIRDESGAVVGAISVLVDITEAPTAVQPEGRKALDEDQVREVIELLISDSPGWFGVIREAIARSDADAIARLASGISGPIGHFGPSAAVDAAARLEERARSADLAGARQAADALEVALQHLLPGLAGLLGPSPADPRPCRVA